MKKKLLVFTSSFPRWKNDIIPPFVYELSKRLTSKFDVYVLAPHYTNAKRYEIMGGMKVYRFKYFFERYEKLACFGGILPMLKKNKLYFFEVPFFIIAEFFNLKKLVKQIKPDIIHVHWIIPQGFIAMLIKKLTGVPYVVTTHGGDIFGVQGKIPRYIKKITLKNAKYITVVSNAIKREILNKIDSNLDIKVIPMGVDSKLFNPNKKDLSLKKKYNINGHFLLFVGRLTEKKGVMYLLEAMPKVIKEFPKTKLMIIGSGELEQKLKKLVQKLKIQNNIIFMGSIQNKELPKYYATADIFIGPSIIAKGGDTEGLGLTFVEAGLCGCLLIGSDIGGVSDVIIQNNGLFVKEKDSGDISDKIIKLMKNPMKNKNRTRKMLINKFDWKIIKEKYEDIIK
ncbi:glycosyltransferase family 4 protein [Candidatus Woesearchaeota archaeon]|nr:glycosyltransferase family 4 protein [Candidatus Woesearchaeota archaeon]